MNSEPVSTSNESTDQQAKKWCALSSHQRRVLGVLVEKAKTTPDNYPLSINALRNGCNQKSNRFPQLELDEDQVDEALEDLRKLHAVSLVQGDGRVDKHRHLAYEWLGVSKVELAVMAELLLRGAQTIGELRGRAARMEPIKGMSELSPLIESLIAKGLVLYLTPPGRGAVVTHNLYQPRELEKVQREHGAGPTPQVAAAPQAANETPASVSAVQAPASEGTDATETEALRRELADLRAELMAVREETNSRLEMLEDALDKLRG